MIGLTGDALGDVLWSLGFLARHALLILGLAAIPTVQRIVAAIHPHNPRIYAWPIELLVAATRIGTIVLVFWLGWNGDASVRRGSLGTVGDAFGALGTFMRHDWGRLLVAVLVAAIMLVALGVLAGPVVELTVRQLTEDARIASAWRFGVRNMLIIPVFYAVAYGLIRPALLHT